MAVHRQPRPAIGVTAATPVAFRPPAPGRPPELGDNRRVNYALFDDSGKFLAGRVMSEADSSIQVELDSGKRVKVKSAHVLLRFEKPQPAELIAQGQALASEIDLDLAWEFAQRRRVRLRRPGARLLRQVGRPGAAGRRAVPPVRRAALLPPHGQGRVPQGARGDGQGRAAGHRAQAPAGAADRGLGRRARRPARRPQPVRDQLYKILFRPDKNAAEYKAVVEASQAARSARRSTC